MIEFPTMFSLRTRHILTVGDADLVNRIIHSQLSGTHPAPGGALCASAAKTEVLPSVRQTPSQEIQQQKKTIKCFFFLSYLYTVQPFFVVVKMTLEAFIFKIII